MQNMITEKAKYTVNVNYSDTTHTLPVLRTSLWRKRKINIKKVLIVTLEYIIPCVLLAWIILSWADVICNNMSTFEYAWWNAFRFFK